jgi:hypothetical protein
MRKPLRFVAGAALIALVAVLAHLALIEVGREVVTLHVTLAGGGSYSRRLWIVDDGAASWLHSAGADWRAVFESPRVVKLERAGETRRYRATPVPGPHPEIHRLLREKYGIADRWVRFVGPDPESVLAVRLDPE